MAGLYVCKWNVSCGLINVKQHSERSRGTGKRLRNHPSIVLFCGNNEIAEAWANWGWKNKYSIYQQEKMEDDYNKKSTNFDYGNLSRLNVFEETHPEVMGNFIRKFNWGHELNYTPDYKPQRVLMKHEKLKYRLLTFVEKHFLGGRHLFGYKNWKVIS